MIITKEQQHAWVSNYVKEKHTQDECIGFIDGIQKTLDVVNKMSKEKELTQVLETQKKDKYIHDLEEIPNLDLAEKAHYALSKLPPRLDDTDMILSEVIKRFELLHLESVQNSI